MRTAAAILLVFAGCARNLRSADPANWLELRSGHFILRTDLPEAEADSAIRRLEVLRAALLSAAWPDAPEPSETTVVVELADAREVGEFALRQVEGFSGRDAFGQPLIVMSAGEDRIVKHELTHILNSAFLMTQPPWVQEGLAAYLETLRFDGETVVRGEARPERIDFLRRHSIRYFDEVIGAADDPQISASETFAFQSAAWLLVHWMIDARPEAFRQFLARLGRGENAWLALAAAFPGLHEQDLQQALRRHLDAPGAIAARRSPIPAWTGSVAGRRLPPADVHATRAELYRSAPAQASRDDREARIRAELTRALVEDPGNPLALRLSGNLDPTPAIRAHPDDWRAWVLYYDKFRERWAIEQAVRLAPRNPDVLYRLAIASHDEGDAARAVSEARRALEAGRSRWDVLDVVAQIYAANGRCEDARAVEERAVNALPGATSAELPAILPRVAAFSSRCESRQPVSRAPRRQVFPLLQATNAAQPGIDSPAIVYRN